MGKMSYIWAAEAEDGRGVNWSLSPTKRGSRQWNCGENTGAEDGGRSPVVCMTACGLVQNPRGSKSGHSIIKIQFICHTIHRFKAHNSIGFNCGTFSSLQKEIL